MVEAFQVLGTKAGRVSTESVGVLLILNVPFGGHLVVGRGVGKWNSHSHIEGAKPTSEYVLFKATIMGPLFDGSLVTHTFSQFLLSAAC